MKTFYYITILFIALSFSSYGQKLHACFSVTKTRSCTPFTIQLINCSGGTSIKPLYSISGPNGYLNQDSSSTVTLITPGFYSITQYVNNGSSGSADTTINNYIEVLAIPTPTFKVGICESGKVTVSVPGSPYEEYIVSYGDGSANDTVLAGNTSTHFYSTYNQTTITVTGNYVPGNCGASSSTQIQPFPNLLATVLDSIRVLNQANSGSAVVAFNTQAQFKYKVMVSSGGGVYVPIDSILYSSGNVKRTYSNLNSSQPLSFKIVTYDDCGHEVSSEVLSSIPLTVLNGNNQVTLNWEKTGGIYSNFNLYRNDTLLKTLTSTDTTFTDTDITCGKDYCYTLNGNFQNGGTSALSQSASFCVTGKSINTPPSVSGIYTTISNQNAHIFWDQSPASPSAYQVSKSIDGSSFSFLDSSNTNSYTDHGVDLNKSMCYEISYMDACGNTAPTSPSVCPVELKVQETGTGNQISWTPYQGPGSGSVSYYLLIFNENNQVIDSINVNGKTDYTDPVRTSNGIISYQLVITGTNFNSTSNKFEVKKTMVIRVPTAFSPNGDNINDVFKAEGIFVKDFKMMVLNNWGELLFVSEDIKKGWDGTYKGSPVVTGAYAFTVYATDENGDKQVLSGMVTLVK